MSVGENRHASQSGEFGIWCPLYKEKLQRDGLFGVQMTNTVCDHIEGVKIRSIEKFKNHLSKAEIVRQLVTGVHVPGTSRQSSGQTIYLWPVSGTSAEVRCD